MRFGFDLEQSFEYISKIETIIKPLNPMVIYLHSSNIEQRVKLTAKERDGWLDGVIDYHVNSSYGKSINADGFDGYISCLLERQKRECKILERLSIKNVVIEDAQSDWEEAYQRIRQRIEE